MRPSWQVDLKWVLGLAACLAVIAGGVLYSLARITERDTAVPLSTAVIAIGINDRVTDEEYAQVQAAATANPAAEVTLSPTAVTVTGGEIAGLSKDDASMLVAGKLADVLYEDGASAADSLIVKPPPDTESETTAISLGPVGALSSGMHSRFQTYFLIAAAVSVLLLAGVILCSRGAGRLGAPALILALSGLPLLALWAALDSAVGPGGVDDKAYVAAAREAFRGAATDVRTLFLVIVLGAAASVLSSILGAAGTWAVRKIRSRRRATAPAEPGAPEPAPLVPEVAGSGSSLP